MDDYHDPALGIDLPMVILDYTLRNGDHHQDELPMPVAVLYITGPEASHTYKRARIIAYASLSPWDRTP